MLNDTGVRGDLCDSKTRNIAPNVTMSGPQAVNSNSRAANFYSQKGKGDDKKFIKVFLL